MSAQKRIKAKTLQQHKLIVCFCCELCETCYTLCRKVSQKLQAPARIPRYMDTARLQHLMAAFALSKFRYCPLVWVFLAGTLNHIINHVHERALRIACKDNRRDFGLL